jgi:pyridoxine 5-phosphate synthase
MTNLLINIDHVATLRNARRETFPDPVQAAFECELGGADGIVFHLREDRRHITDRDVQLLRQTVRGKLDFELSTNPDVVAICARTKPDLATLVPERREEVTTEGGLDAMGSEQSVRDAVTRLLDAGIDEVALFLDPDLEQIDKAAQIGANAVELHTGDYANARTREERRLMLDRLAEAAAHAHDLGLAVHAGHGLDYMNYRAFSERVEPLDEVSIGFAIVSRAVFTGLRRAVREMRDIVKTESA